MRTAIVSDVHANLEALEAVLADARERSVDRVVCLGDFVGYGPDPNACVARLREVTTVSVIGNHDFAALGRMDTMGFNEYARAAAEWTRGALDDETRVFLNELPLDTVLDGVRLVHASPLDPVRWTYVLSFEEAQRQFPSFEEQICFIGHSHIPIVIESDGGKIQPIPFGENEPITLETGRRFIINVGSVGQPRDRDPRAGYVIHDAQENKVLLRRLEYPVEAVQEKILTSGLPPFLAQRLAAGV